MILTDFSLARVWRLRLHGTDGGGDRHGQDREDASTGSKHDRPFLRMVRQVLVSARDAGVSDVAACPGAIARKPPPPAGELNPRLRSTSILFAPAGGRGSRW